MNQDAAWLPGRSKFNHWKCWSDNNRTWRSWFINIATSITGGLDQGSPGVMSASLSWSTHHQSSPISQTEHPIITRVHLSACVGFDFWPHLWLMFWCWGPIPLKEFWRVAALCCRSPGSSPFEDGKAKWEDWSCTVGDLKIIQIVQNHYKIT